MTVLTINCTSARMTCTRGHRDWSRRTGAFSGAECIWLVLDFMLVRQSVFVRELSKLLNQFTTTRSMCQLKWTNYKCKQIGTLRQDSSYTGFGYSIIRDICTNQWTVLKLRLIFVCTQGSHALQHTREALRCEMSIRVILT